MQLFLQRLYSAQQVAGLLQGADRVLERLWTVATAQQFFEGRIAFGATDHRRHLGRESVRRALVAPPERKHDDP
ncbi:hypothetical protein D3C72_2370180 [compost metagenome]